MTQTNATCSENGPVFSPTTDHHEGCPILTRVRHVVIPKGVSAFIDWPMRRPNGSAFDLLSCFPADPDGEGSLTASLPAGGAKVVRVRFTCVDIFEQPIYEVNGVVSEAAEGRVIFSIPSQIYNSAGIYEMSIGIVDEDTEVVIAIDQGLLSVEGTLWGDTSQSSAPPTLGEIRMHLRDTPIENTLTDEEEYSADEIIQAIVAPIRQWNELPPPVACYSCCNFPYKYHWRQAIVGELMRVAAHHYMRNNFNATHGGYSGNFKDKYREYMAFSESYRQEWIEFCREKKVSINLSGSFSSVHSPYGGRIR